jgi:hypothetical protein
VGPAVWPEPSASPPRRSSPSSRAAAFSALSSGLSAHLRMALSDELERLQEGLQSLLSADPPPAAADYAAEVRSLARRLGWLRSDLALLTPVIGSAVGDGGGAGDMETASSDDGVASPQTRCEPSTLLKLAESTEEFVLSLRGEVASTERAEAEKGHADRLCAAVGLSRAEVAHNGDCLFACAHRWLEHHVEARRKYVHGAGDDEVIAIDGGGTAREGGAEEEEDSIEAIASLCRDPTDVRQLVVDLMREKCVGESSADCDDPSGGLDHEMRRRMVASVREALKGGGTDGTSVALRTALKQRKAAQRKQEGGTDQPAASGAAPTAASAAAAASASASAAALESYLEVMGKVGIYGERLEIEALAALLGVPVHIYYFTGEPEPAHAADGGAGEDSKEAALGMQQPTEVVVPPGVDAASEPLRLLHLVHERHFELLLPAA